MIRYNRRSPRRGALLICVVVCLSIVTALAASGVQSALMVRRQLRVDRQLLQAELLLEAGASRAARRLQTTPDYPGETWSLDGETLPRCGPATIEIGVQRSGADGPATIVVEVVLPADAPRPVRRRNTFSIPKTALSEESAEGRFSAGAVSQPDRPTPVEELSNVAS